MFYERRAVSTVQLYFLDVADYRSRLVMACGACGALFGTDDKAGQEAIALDSFAGAAGQIGSSIAAGAPAGERIGPRRARLEAAPASDPACGGPGPR